MMIFIHFHVMIDYPRNTEETFQIEQTNRKSLLFKAIFGILGNCLFWYFNYAL